FGGLRGLTNLREKNETLRERLRRLEAAQRDFHETARERERLLALLEERDWKSGKTLGARVIGAGPSSLEWSAFLNKGRSHGTAAGMAVVAAEGLVGRVVVVGESYSKALLLVDPEHSVGSRLTGSGETGVVTGAGGAEMPFELIDQTTDVQEGETVVTSGYDGGVYPPGIPIGRVSRVVRSRDGLSKTAYVRPFVDFTRLDFVLLLLESGPRTPSQ
ncbi:MAG: rod shape-determining protein MreC, partial [Candidatus Methylomirabilales bacterium]